MKTVYSVLLLPSAEKQIGKLPFEVQQRITSVLLALRQNPRPVSAKRMSSKDEFRIRVGDYRIIYQVRDKALMVLVVKVGHRRDVYKH